jgi:hypothetical protein
MKTKTLFAALLFLTGSLFAQNRAIADLFNKYNTAEGFTTINISSNFLSMFTDDDENDLKKIHSIKMLAQGDDNHIRGLNFYDELKKDLDRDNFKEIMRVKDADTDLKILVRESGDIIREFVLISVENDENFLLYIEGDFEMDDLEEVNCNFQIEELDKIGKKCTNI